MTVQLRRLFTHSKSLLFLTLHMPYTVADLLGHNTMYLLRVSRKNTNREYVCRVHWSS
jgi:hypothetical protein